MGQRKMPSTLAPLITLKPMKKFLLVLAAFSTTYPVSAVCDTPGFRDCADCPDMVRIPAGRFTMGSAAVSLTLEDGTRQSVAEFEELPAHEVSVPAFSLGRFEVTQQEWLAIMSTNPSAHQGAGLPVESISWNDAQEFLSKLSAKTGKQYRLPTEAEWEYAARAASTTPTYLGQDAAALDQVAWHAGNAAGKSHLVGQKKPNNFGLYDMLGNVWERTEDCWHFDYDGAPDDGSAWTTGQCDRRVVRGGSWINLPQFLRPAYRFRYAPDSRYEFVGLRVARSN